MTAPNIYDSGIPCKRKHYGFRYRRSHGCVDCAKLSGKASYAKTVRLRELAKIADEKAEWRALAIGCRPKGVRIHREIIIKIQTPPWVSKATIDSIYAGCPIGHEVDHIVPLHGRYVSGLHIPSNLQYLTKTENRKKQAKFAS